MELRYTIRQKSEEPRRWCRFHLDLVRLELDSRPGRGPQGIAGDVVVELMGDQKDTPCEHERLALIMK